MSENVRYLNVTEALVIYAEIIRVSRVEAADVQSIDGLESALAQPQQAFDGRDLYETLEEKAGALLYSLCQNHSFTDGNKRVAFIATRQFLRLNGRDLAVATFDALKFMYAIASGEVGSDKAAAWVRDNCVPFTMPE